MMDNEFMLTTVDNPYNPFEQFTLWNLFDKENGYNTCERLARIMNISDDMTQKEEDEEYNRAADVIIKYDFLDIYKKFFKQNATATNA